MGRYQITLTYIYQGRLLRRWQQSEDTVYLWVSVAAHALEYTHQLIAANSKKQQQVYTLKGYRT